MAATNPPTFEQARGHEEFRQTYLDTLLPHCSDSVSAIIYDPLLQQLRHHCREWLTEGYLSPFEFDISFPKNDDCIMFVPPLIPRKFGTGIRSPILVSKFGFENDCLTTEERVLSAVFDHEVIHCYDEQRGFSLSNGITIGSHNILELSPSIYTPIQELRAYRVQLHRWKEKKIEDPQWMDHIVQSLLRYTSDLELTHPKTKLEEMAREEYLSNGQLE